MATALQRIASSLAAMQGTAPQRPPVSLALSAASVMLVGRALRPACQTTTATGAVALQKGGRHS